MGLIVLTTIGWGQERVNRPNLSFIHSSGIITESNGWHYNNSSGEWVSNKNFIDDKHYDSQGSLLSYMDQNFISIQTKVVRHENRDIYVLIVEKWDGSWKYPSIRQDWIAYKTYNLFFFEESEYNKLLNINNTVTIKCVSQSSIRVNSDGTIEDTVQYILINSYGKYNYDYVFSATRSTEGNIRFYIPYDNGKYSQDSPCDYGEKFDFKTSYFETSLENFSKLTTFNN